MELLKIHLKLTAKINPCVMIHLVKNEIYPIEEAMQLCKQFNILDALAYLLERTGKLDQAFEQYIILIEGTLRAYLI
jgi:hypothetical protein